MVPLCCPVIILCHVGSMMAKMKRILVVDDDPNTLAGLQRVLRPLRMEWDMVFLESPHEALERMNQESFQIVMTDLTMRGMDGPDFLRRVKEAHPGIVRLVLSGASDEERMVRCLGVSHQFIAKPCDPEFLKSVIIHSGTLTENFTNEAVSAFVAGIAHLPALPALYQKVCAMCESDGATPENLAKLIERDPGMTSTILRVVNSPYFGRPRKVVSMIEAIFSMGTESIKALILHAGLFREVGPFESTPFNVKHLWAHSVQVAAAARKIAVVEGASASVQDCSFTGGLLHDVGILLLASRFPEEYQRVDRCIQEQGITLSVAEHEVFGVTHGDVGAYLLGLWALPQEVIRPVAWHHVPNFECAQGFTPTVAVHGADVLAGNEGHHPVFGTSNLDELYLKAIGLGASPARWKSALEE